MSPEQKKLNELFSAALAKASPEDRERYLTSACGQDSDLRRQLDSLLTAHAQSGDFLHQNTMALNSPPLEGPGSVIGRYKLREKIGEGGCGVVYVAEQEEPVRRRVALKVIKLGMDTRSVVARFEGERQALAMMDHPNIAKVLDAGATDTGRPYFVMELVRGIKLTDYCDQNKLAARERLDLFIKICHAIQHAHQKGIIHRDIKPSNVLVTMHDGVPVPKVIDFGIAKATEGRLTDLTVYTELHQFIGTPAYMSPEQAEMSALDIDTRSDIYSLGVLLYELLTGCTPFDAEELLASGLDAMRRTIRDKDPLRPSTKLHAMSGEELTTMARRRGVDAPKLIHLLRGDLDWIVMKSLEKDRTRRYETANGLAMDIERHLHNDPVVARPPSSLYRFQKMVRRNKLVFAAASAVGLALIIGLSFSTWSFVRERKAHAGELAERRTADEQRQRAEASARTAQEQGKRAETREAEARRLLYVANMNLAQQAWDQINIGRLPDLLEETQGSLDRGFEWYYWQRQTHLQAVKTLRGHLAAVTSAAYSADGRRIVTGSEDQTAKVWDADSGRELLTLKGHSGEVLCVAYSRDGQRIVTGSFDQTAKVWDADSGRVLLTLKGHSGWISSVAFSPDGHRIVTANQDETAKVWEAASGRELFTFKGQSDVVVSVAFSPDGQWIVTSSRDGTPKVWEAASGRELITLKGHSSGVGSVAFSPDGQRIVTGSYDRTAKVWEAATGQELQTLKGHSSLIVAVAFSPDGQRIVTGSYDQTTKVWETASGRELFTLKGHSGEVNSVAFSPDGLRIVTSSRDGTAKVWDAAGERESLTLKGHTGTVLSAAFSPDSQRIVTGSWDRSVKVWEAASGRELLTLKGHTNGIWSVAFSPDGQLIATGSADQMVKVWEAASGRELLTLKGHGYSIRSVAFSSDGRRIVTGSQDRTAKVWDAASGRELLTIKGHTDEVVSVAFSPDGQRIVTGSDDGTAKVWEAASGRELLTIKGHSSGVLSVAFFPDSQRIVTGSYDGTAKAWEAATGRELFTLKGHRAGITSLAISLDGQRILTGSDDQTAKLWESTSGRELLTLKGSKSGVYSVAFSPDGQRIATGDMDGTIRVWEGATAGQVAAWRVEEQAAAKHLTALQRERTAEKERQRIAQSRDEGVIKRWLVLGPIESPTAQSGTEGLGTEQIQGESQLDPRMGEMISIGTRELKWQEMTLEDCVIDFNAILGQAAPRSVAYAVCCIRSEGEQRGVRMLVGSDGEAKVYLNGKQVYLNGKAAYKLPFQRAAIVDQDTVPDIALKAGLNVLVLKVVNGVSPWEGSVRFTDAQGNPVKGIKVTLGPEG